jgi:hypothetical protein
MMSESGGVMAVGEDDTGARSESGGVMAVREDDDRSLKGCPGGRSSRSQSVEVSSPPPATRFVCEAGRPCESCNRYTKKGKAKGAEAQKTVDASDGSGSDGSGGEEAVEVRKRWIFFEWGFKEVVIRDEDHLIHRGGQDQLIYGCEDQVIHQCWISGISIST